MNQLWNLFEDDIEVLPEMLSAWGRRLGLEGGFLGSGFGLWDLWFRRGDVGSEVYRV